MSDFSEWLYKGQYISLLEDKNLTAGKDTSLLKVIKRSRILNTIVCIGSSYALYRLFNNPKVNNIAKVALAYIGVTRGFVAVHAHCFRQLYKAVKKKNSGKILSKKDIKNAKITAKIGDITNKIGTFLPGVIYPEKKREYNAIYSATVDYVLGKKRNFHAKRYKK